MLNSSKSLLIRRYTEKTNQEEKREGKGLKQRMIKVI